ncbi:LacI family DNA-binding transcriptional regulator [Nocardiopsis sp. NPDC049922]|uniref:LacI family DNA-binding transcriptional regulator n=1 Tax=Nocardiopsis sp. NPDC049922 TaxID=3155157 RepID=UPI003410CCDE
MSARDGRAPVMADVARLAGVSHQTVSRVVNGHRDVRTETVARVRAAIDALGYRRNATARALVTRRTQRLGALTLDVPATAPRTLAAVERTVRGAGYFLSVVGLDGHTRADTAAAVATLTDQAVEGCVLLAPWRSVAEALGDLSAPRPLVVVGGAAGSGLPAVDADQAGGARAATRHLLDLGHRTVHHLAGPPGWLEGEARARGWRRALTEAGAPVPEPLGGDGTPRSGYERGLRLAEAHGRGEAVTAVFAANDAMALGLLRALRERGIAVPRQVSVVGFDDVPEAAYLTPPLTTVGYDADRLGRDGAALLLAALAGGTARNGAPPHASVPARLRVRDSTAAP